MGCAPFFGQLPSRIDGTDSVVFSCALVAFGNHVARSARRARLGKRTRSILPSRPSRSCAGNASKLIKTIGGVERAFALYAFASPVSTRLDVSPMKRNEKTKKTGASIRYVKAVRTPCFER